MWIGTQADEAFPDSWKSNTAGNLINFHAKIYLSPKLWYLRASVLEVQDILPLTALKEGSFQIKAQLGFQMQKTKILISRNGNPSWNEDLIFVAAEPFGDHLIFYLEYQSKWVRTRTMSDYLDPKWNEQYTWKVYDPCTVLTIGVFDSSGALDIDGGKEATHLDFRMGKVWIRISTLETGKVYRNTCPLVMLGNSGVQKKWVS
ncbi:hypothetical protein REPUB_Repub06bG0065800 [Reevesia pubescens]